MEETISDWWMDARTNWHRGRPLEGWWQAGDGRWHAPDDRDDDDPAGDIEGEPPAEAAHFAGGSPSPDRERGDQPGWGRNAILASLAIVAIVVAGAAAIVGSGLDQNQSGPTTTVVAGAAVPPSLGPEVPQTTSTVTATSSSGGVAQSASPTTERASETASTVVPTSTSAPPTSGPPSIAAPRPGATCSPEGATALTAVGVPLTCTAEKCHGVPFDTPRWRRTTC